MKKIFSFGGKKLLEKQDPQSCLPNVVVKCCQYIEQSVASAEGVFRIGVDPRIVEEVKKKIEKKPNIEFSSIPEMGPHVASALLKAFLRQLPDSVCTFQYYQFFLQTDQPNPAGTAADLAHLIEYLPVPNNNLLRYICAFLASLIHFSSQTRMNASSLAQFMGPHIFRPQPSEQSQQLELANANTVARITQLLIEQYQTVFRESPRAAIQRLTGTAAATPAPAAAAPGYAPATPQPSMYGGGSGRYSMGYGAPPVGGFAMSTGYGATQQQLQQQPEVYGAQPPQQQRFIPLMPAAATAAPSAGAGATYSLPHDVQHQFSMFGVADSHGSLIPLPGQQQQRRLATQSAVSAVSPVGSAAGQVPDEPDIEDVFRAEAEAAHAAAMEAMAAGVAAAEAPVVNVGSVAGTYSTGGVAVADRLLAAQDAEQKYRENWRVLKETEKLRRESSTREQQLEKDKRALERQLTELRAAWAAERARAPLHAQQGAMTVTPAAGSSSSNGALLTEMESLRATVAALQQENDSLKRQLEQQKRGATVPVDKFAGAGAAALGSELTAELRRLDAAALEIGALLSGGGASTVQSPQRQQSHQQPPQQAFQQQQSQPLQQRMLGVAVAGRPVGR